MKMVRNCALLLLLMLVPLAGAQAAKLYKWTDAEGNVHYSQSPPSERPAEVITTEPAPAPQPAEQGNAGEQQPPEGLSSADQTNIKIKQQNCESARKNLDIYKTADSVVQPDGTELMLTDEVRAAKIKETEQQIKLYCD